MESTLFKLLNNQTLLIYKSLILNQLTTYKGTYNGRCRAVDMQKQFAKKTRARHYLEEPSSLSATALARAPKQLDNSCCRCTTTAAAARRRFDPVRAPEPGSTLLNCRVLLPNEICEASFRVSLDPQIFLKKYYIKYLDICMEY